MKSKTVTQYACDFCGKRGLSSFYMRRHETYCTANPNRSCRLCGKEKPDLEGAIKTAKQLDDTGLEKLRKATDGCPACMLAALRQAGVIRDLETVGIHFDYVEEVKWYWEKQDNNEREAGCNCWQDAMK